MSLNRFWRALWRLRVAFGLVRGRQPVRPHQRISGGRLEPYMSQPMAEQGVSPDDEFRQAP